MTRIFHLGSARGASVVLLATTTLTSGAYAQASPETLTFSPHIAGSPSIERGYADDLHRLFHAGGLTGHSTEDVTLAMAMAREIDEMVESRVGFAMQSDYTTVTARQATAEEDGLYHLTIRVGVWVHDVEISQDDLTMARTLIEQPPVADVSWVSLFDGTVVGALGGFFRLFREPDSPVVLRGSDDHLLGMGDYGTSERVTAHRSTGLGERLHSRVAAFLNDARDKLSYIGHTSQRRHATIAAV